jgi:protein FrlC
MALANETPKDYVKYLGEKFSHVHLLDATPMGHLALGDGNLPIDEYIDELEKNGYKGKYSFEFTDMNYRHKPEEADIKSIKWLIDHNKLKI